MRKRTRICIVALAVVLCLAGVNAIAFPQFLAVDSSTRKGTALHLADESVAVWLKTTSSGVENVLPVAGSNIVYASDLSGFVTRFDGADRASLSIAATRKLGDYCLGLASGRDGTVYVAVSDGGNTGWNEGRTSILALGEDLAERGSIPVGLPCLNGIAIDARGGLWLASSNFNFLHPEGAISYISFAPSPDDAPSDAKEAMATVATGGLFNGLCARSDGTVLAADTLSSIYSFSEADADRALSGAKPIATKPRSPLALYRKTSFIEAFDDVCADSRGRIWSANPLSKGRIAVYDPATRERRVVELPRFGYASSCRIRIEGTREILYVSELRAPDGSGFNGRGVLCFPIDALAEAER